MPDYRETLIRIDHGRGIAEIWTSDRGWKAKLSLKHAKQLNKQALGEWFEIPADRIRILGPRKQISSEKRQILAANLSKARHSSGRLPTE